METFFEIELPDFTEITPDGQRLLLEKQVKHNGIWRIHKSDPDNVFPSDPHGDRVDGENKGKTSTYKDFASSGVTCKLGTLCFYSSSAYFTILYSRTRANAKDQNLTSNS